MKDSVAIRFQVSLKGVLLLILLAAWFPLFVVLRPHTAHAAVNAATSTCPAGRKCVYLPSIFGPIPTDLVITGVEVTQAVQDSQNSVPLVANRPTTIRIFAHAEQTSTPVKNVKIGITALGPNNQLLSDSPRAYSATVPLSNNRGNYSSTINIALPSNWLSGTVQLTIKLDPDNTLPEVSKSNNTLTKTLVFNDVPALQIMIVPIRYTIASSGKTYPAPTQDTISDWIRRTYPISQIQISWHAPFAYSGDLTSQTDFTDLLQKVSDLRSSEGAPASLGYYGLIPTSDGSSTWFTGGIAGIGWIGSRTAIGLDYSDQSSQIAAHEIGHNLGMWHTPCGGAAGPDPNYPYKDGSIGQYGLDVYSGTFYPSTEKDIMTYCNPKWISDYTYKTLFNTQVKATASSASIQSESVGAAQRGLLVRARIQPNGAKLLPAYVLPGEVTQAPEAGDYQVQVLGTNGDTLVQVPVRAYMAGEEGETQMTGINALIPLPEQPAAKLRLLKDKQVLAEQSLQSAPADQASRLGMTAEKSGNNYQVRWNAGSQPALVRYTADGGKTWMTLGTDISGSELSVPASGLPNSGVTFQVIQAGVWK